MAMKTLRRLMSKGSAVAQIASSLETTSGFRDDVWHIFQSVFIEATRLHTDRNSELRG